MPLIEKGIQPDQIGRLTMYRAMVYAGWVGPEHGEMEFEPKVAESIRRQKQMKRGEW